MAAPRRTGVWAWIFALVAALRVGAAGYVRAEDGVGRAALPAADRVLTPVTDTPAFRAAASAGYGVTESQAGEGAHHRAQGTLAAAAGVTPNLAVSLAVDGRYDVHPKGDTDAVGTPQLALVGGLHAADRVRVGAALQVQVPGRSAPSLDFGALALSASGLAEWDATRAFRLAGMLGFRFDRGAHAAPDVARLSKADRLGLGLSSFNALPFGVAAFQHVAALDLLGEVSGEVLMGKGAPDALHSPLRAALGGRWPLVASLVAEVLLEFSLSQRSNYARVEPLIPAEPRVVIAAGLRYTPDFSAPRPPAPPAPMAAPAITQLSGEIADADGVRLSGVHVTLRVAGRAFSSESADDGSFVLDDLPRGSAELAIEGAGLLAISQRVELDRSQVSVPIVAVRVAASSQLRGLVRSFAGVALSARVRVLPDAGAVTADKDGRFVLELRAGEYEVEIECAGYLTQHRKISVQDNGVTLLNVELHETPR